jgi:acetyltransferase-like isoleucine patch superfamily enzyme
MSTILGSLRARYDPEYMSSSQYISFLKKKGVTIGEGTRFFGHVFIDYTRPCLVEIGRKCNLTDGVKLLTHSYDWAVLREKFGEVLCSSGKVVLQDNVFVGFNAIILKGVTIGKNTIIGAGSVVTHSIPSNCVAAGNPCKIIMTLEEYHEKRKAAYVEEAKAYALEIYLKTKKIPKITDFWEEFPIFIQKTPNLDDLPSQPNSENQNIATRQRARVILGSAYSSFLTSEPVYKSFQEFLVAAGIPKEKIDAR